MGLNRIIRRKESNVVFYITGDTHGDFRKLGKRHAPATYGDYVIICGDMGLLWDKDKTPRL